VCSQIEHSIELLNPDAGANRSIWLHIIERIVTRDEAPIFGLIITKEQSDSIRAHWAQQHIKTNRRTKVTQATVGLYRQAMADHGAQFTQAIILPLVRRYVKLRLHCEHSCGAIIGGAIRALQPLLDERTVFSEADAVKLDKTIRAIRQSIWKSASVPLVPEVFA